MPIGSTGQDARRSAPPAARGRGRHRGRGRVAELFAGLPMPPGAAPQLRLLAALHELVLAGRAPELARLLSQRRRDCAPDAVWPVAATRSIANFDWLRARMGLTVQTNEPGRAAVLFTALLWLTDRYGLPIRLLEIGASAGLNLRLRPLLPTSSTASSSATAARRFVSASRGSRGPDDRYRRPPRARSRSSRGRGCDLAPLDPSSTDHRLRLLSYIWPDELHGSSARGRARARGRGAAAMLAAPGAGVAVGALAATPPGS